MKVSVWIPEAIFARADSAAKRASQTRSEFYAMALRAFIAKHKSEDGDWQELPEPKVE